MSEVSLEMIVGLMALAMIIGVALVVFFLTRNLKEVNQHLSQVLGQEQLMALIDKATTGTVGAELAKQMLELAQRGFDLAESLAKTAGKPELAKNIDDLQYNVTKLLDGPDKPNSVG